MAPVPDIAGFVASRDVLFDNFGVAIDFLIPKPYVLPPGTPADESGVPLDPFSVPAPTGDDSQDFDVVTVVCSVVTRPFSGRGQVRDQTVGVTPVGRIAEEQIGVILRIADYERVGAPDPKATHARLWGERFEIREWRPDGIGALRRWLAYLTAEGEE